MSLNKLMNFNGIGLGLKVAMDELKVKDNTTIDGILYADGGVEIVGGLNVNGFTYPNSDIVSGGNMVSNGLKGLSIKDAPVQLAYGKMSFLGNSALPIGQYPIFTQITQANTTNEANTDYLEVYPTYFYMTKKGTYRVAGTIDVETTSASSMDYFAIIKNGLVVLNCKVSAPTSGGSITSTYNIANYVDVNDEDLISLAMSSHTVGQNVNVKYWNLTMEYVKDTP